MEEGEEDHVLMMSMQCSRRVFRTASTASACGPATSKEAYVLNMLCTGHVPQHELWVGAAHRVCTVVLGLKSGGGRDD